MRRSGFTMSRLSSRLSRESQDGFIRSRSLAERLVFLYFKYLSAQFTRINAQQRTAADRIRCFHACEFHAARFQIFSFGIEVHCGEADVIQARTPVVQIEAGIAIPAGGLDDVERRTVTHLERHARA